jgi:hypothetical protein
MANDFKNAIISIQNAASNSAIVWRNLVPFAEHMMAGCWTLKEAVAGEISDLASHLHAEIGRWQFDLLEAESVALSVSSLAEMILETGIIGEPSDNLPSFLSPLYSWHAALCSESGNRILLDEDDDHLMSSSTHGFVTGLASYNLRNTLHSNINIQNDLSGWEFWEQWSGQVQNHLRILNHSEYWNDFVSWAYSDRSAIMLSRLERQFKKLKSVCSHQKKIQLMINILQRNSQNKVPVNQHPLHLELLRLKNQSFPAPGHTFENEEEE